MSSLGILQHDARDIRAALKSSNTYNVYHRKPNEQWPHRIVDARTRKGVLEVRRLVFGEWESVAPLDQVYQQ